jgi:hypothetical protein
VHACILECPCLYACCSMQACFHAHGPPCAWRLHTHACAAHTTAHTTTTQVVSSNDKARFVLDDSVDPPRIRAAQGHSVPLEAPVLEPVTDAAAVPLAIHITSAEGWEAIQVRGWAVICICDCLEAA